MPEIQEKTCLDCGNTFRGRIDKKFCSDQCRSAYNNRLNNEETQYIKNVNSILRKNRKILLQLNPEGKSKVHQDKLAKLGFNFHFFTSIYKTKEGAIYYYCYDQGYLPIEKDFFLLVKKTEYVNT